MRAGGGGGVIQLPTETQGTVRIYDPCNEVREITKSVTPVQESYEYQQSFPLSLAYLKRNKNDKGTMACEVAWQVICPTIVKP